MPPDFMSVCVLGAAWNVTTSGLSGKDLPAYLLATTWPAAWPAVSNETQIAFVLGSAVSASLTSFCVPAIRFVGSVVAFVEILNFDEFAATIDLSSAVRCWAHGAG